MYGYSFAAAEVGVEHRVTHGIVAYPSELPWSGQVRLKYVSPSRVTWLGTRNARITIGTRVHAYDRASGVLDSNTL